MTRIMKTPINNLDSMVKKRNSIQITISSIKSSTQIENGLIALSPHDRNCNSKESNSLYTSVTFPSAGIKMISGNSLKLMELFSMSNS